MEVVGFITYTVVSSIFTRNQKPHWLSPSPPPHQVPWAASWMCRWAPRPRGSWTSLLMVEGWTTGTGCGAATWSWSAPTTTRCRPCPGGSSTWAGPSWRPPAGRLLCSPASLWSVVFTSSFIKEARGGSVAAAGFSVLQIHKTKLNGYWASLCVWSQLCYHFKCMFHTQNWSLSGSHMHHVCFKIF